MERKYVQVDIVNEAVGSTVPFSSSRSNAHITSRDSNANWSTTNLGDFSAPCCLDKNRCSLLPVWLCHSLSWWRGWI